MFNYNLSDTSPHWAGNRYAAPAGNYVSSFSNKILDGYLGDWVILKLPIPIILTKYRFYNRTDPGLPLVSRAPGLWRCYGSNDGSNYIEIKNASNDITSLTASSYTTGYYEKVVVSNPQIPYKYIGFTV